MAGTLRFADGNPEMRVASKSNTAMKTSTTHTGLDKLPSDTTVAIGMSDGSQAVDDNWELAKKALEESGMTVADLERQANVKLPDDLKKQIKSAFLNIRDITWADQGKLNRFVETNDQAYDIIRETAKTLKLDLGKMK